MKHFKSRNRKAQKLGARTSPEVFGYACGECCASFSPGWEVGASGNVDPCPWTSDLAMCHFSSCFWGAQVPDASLYPGWMSACGSIVNDWQNLCVVPD